MHSPQNGKFHGLVATLGATLDTGSDENFISRKVADRLGLPMQPLPFNELREFRDFTGEKLRPDLFVTSSWRVQRGNRTHESKFLVVRNAPFDVLLGRKFIESSSVISSSTALLPLGFSHTHGQPFTSENPSTSLTGKSHRQDSAAAPSDNVDAEASLERWKPVVAANALPIEILSGDTIIQIDAKLDTGTEENWISTELVQRLSLQTIPGPPLDISLFNGTQISSSTVVNFNWRMKGLNSTRFDIFYVCLDKEAPFELLFGHRHLSSEAAFP
jgi:hypothetical protein